jgi:hypothetical protein
LRPLERHLPISSQDEFEKLLATTLQRERQKLREETEAREPQKRASSEKIETEASKETQHENER